jgi:hypothetical protein
MTTEQILPLALSGAEIKKAILDKIAIALNRDCHLNDNLAYGDGFSFKVHIEVHAQDLGREIDSTFDSEAALRAESNNNKQILVSADPEEYASLNVAEADFETKATDPTALRIETGQEVPVRVQDKQGHDEIRGVKYRRDARVK